MIYQQDWLMRQIEAITSYYPTLLFFGGLFNYRVFCQHFCIFFVSGLILFREGLKRLDGMSS